MALIEPLVAAARTRGLEPGPLQRPDARGQPGARRPHDRARRAAGRLGGDARRDRAGRARAGRLPHLPRGRLPGARGRRRARDHRRRAASRARARVGRRARRRRARTAPSGGSSRATSTASSGSPSPRPSRCAPPSWPRSARAGCGSASGAPTRRPTRASPPGSPADGDGLVLEGDKVFCSGAGGIDRALVLARTGEPGPPALVYVDLSAGTEIDRSWYRAGGMRASESHRVRFHGAPVLAVLGEPGELGREPWFSRDAIRTAAAWAGMADAAADGALADLAARGEPDDLRALGAGRIVAARATIDRWLEHAAARADAEPEADLRSLSRAAARGDRRRRAHDPRRGRARLRIAPVRHRHAASTARAATSSCSCSSTGSTRWWPGSAGRRCSEAPADRRLLRRALRGRSRPVGLRDQRRTSRPSTRRRSTRWRAAATRPRSRSAARSAC